MKQRKKFIFRLFLFTLLISPLESEEIKYFIDYPFTGLYEYNQVISFKDEINETELNEIKKNKILKEYYKVYYKNNKIRKAEKFNNSSKKVQVTYYYDKKERLFILVSDDFVKKVDYKKNKIIKLFIYLNGDIHIAESLYKENNLYKVIYYNGNKEIKEYRVFTPTTIKIYSAEGNFIKERRKPRIK